MAGYAYIVLKSTFHREGKRWVAICEDLGTSTFGRSLPEADKRLKEAVVLHLNTLEDVGERQRFFRENHIELYNTMPKKPTICTPTDFNTFVRPYVQRVPELTPA